MSDPSPEPPLRRRQRRHRAPNSCLFVEEPRVEEVKEQNSETSGEASGGAGMDEETKKKVEAAVLGVLRESVTEHKVRAAAAARLGIDLSVPDRKLFVRGVFEGYLRSLPSQEEENEEVEQQQKEEEVEEDGAGGEGKGEQEEGKEAGGGRKREYDDSGDLILSRLSAKTRVTLSEFRGKKLVSIREFYSKDGKELPSSKGISLTPEQWEAFRNAVPAVEDAIKKLGESD
ncbi:hypothetical protein ACP4OV_029644 [Aristida adscensionis]